MLPVCRSKVCAGASTAWYEARTLALVAVQRAPIDPVPMKVAVARTATAAIVFTGSVARAASDAAPVNLTLALVYVNDAMPSIIVRSYIPVTITVPATGAVKPVAVSLDATLPCGVYSVNLEVVTSAGATISIGGNLGVALTYAFPA